MHVGDNRDKAGNQTQVRFFDNMHRLWDTDMIERTLWSGDTIPDLPTLRASIASALVSCKQTTLHLIISYLSALDHPFGCKSRLTIPAPLCILIGLARIARAAPTSERRTDAQSHVSVHESCHERECSGTLACQSR